MPIVDIPIATSTDFGRARKSANNNVYPPSGTALVSTSTRTCERFYDGLNTYSIADSLMRFLASLASDASIISVKLLVTPSSISNANTRNLVGDWINWGPTITVTDYVENPTSGALPIEYSLSFVCGRRFVVFNEAGPIRGAALGRARERAAEMHAQFIAALSTLFMNFECSQPLDFMANYSGELMM